MTKRLSILGSTGSIGQSALDVIARFPDRFQVVALAAGKNVAILAAQAEKHRPLLLSVQDEFSARELRERLSPAVKAEIVFGRPGVEAAATLAEADLVLSAIVGAAGLPPTYAAVRAGKTVALANKETLVMAGDLVMSLAREKDVTILPVDSEHSALFQCLQGQTRRVVDRLILTASGGPFWQMDLEELSSITPAQALDHPRWDMGPRVTVDSATLMNKGLELLEAHHLFDHLDGIFRTLVHAGRAAITGDRIHRVGKPTFQDSLETANLLADATTFAGIRVDHGNLPASKIFTRQHLRGQYQFQVGSIHIRIGQNGLERVRAFSGQVSKGGSDAGFSGATFAAQDHKLFHWAPPL